MAHKDHLEACLQGTATSTVTLGMQDGQVTGAHLIQLMKYSPVGSRTMCGYSGRAMQALAGPHAAGGVSRFTGSPM